MNQPIELEGTHYMKDSKGALVPVSLIRPADLLEDETVCKIMGFAKELSARIARFNSHTIADLSAFDNLLAQEYGVERRGKKGNCTYTSVDGLQRIEMQVQTSVDLGLELRFAKHLVEECLNEWDADECLNKWGADARPEIRAIITRAFDAGKEGKVDRSELFLLLRLDIDDPRWNEAMRAIREAIRVTTSKEYVRFYERDTLEHPWRPVIIDVAKT
ncbi:DUF3164 family protein [Bartonella vinsonii]|uniref:Sulfate transporter n=1 Tax=Bartonella vinsonii subsp. berkhoffii str. Tweed TaxID=1094502 RepID=N6UVF8_BARVB|nr:DUF3164 family protein [Bartonella vinsonii]ENN94038.1 hypothetical protein BVtw_14450 [Bartonella vinsonii subsp. berkhoffii str. Tweed]